MDHAPEGLRLDTEQNKLRTATFAALAECLRTGEILEGRAVVCDADRNLTVEMPSGLRGIIPREEGALGIDTGKTRDVAIVSRVSKPVCFVVTGFERLRGQAVPLLSRRIAQERCQREWVASLVSGQVIPAVVTHLEAFGAFVDIGCGIASLIPIDMISVSRIAHPRERFSAGQRIFAAVRRVEEGRVYLTHKELLGTWEENAARFAAGETVAGIVRSVEHYGIFVELAPNLAGLAEPREGVRAGQHASVYIKSILPQKMKIKLMIVDAFCSDLPAPPLRYFIREGVIGRWRYSPADCPRILETDFREFEIFFEKGLAKERLF